MIFTLLLVCLAVGCLTLGLGRAARSAGRKRLAMAYLAVAATNVGAAFLLLLIKLLSVA